MKKIFFNIVALVLMILLIEGLLQILSFLSPTINAHLSNIQAHEFKRDVARNIDDEELHIRPNPEFPEHDEKGFRNKKVPHTASIVVIGDSQTYGTGAWPNETWPRQFEAMTSLPTYNMSFGSYGPTQYLVLIKEALELKPKLIIVACYSGNDLFDSYNFVYRRKKLQEFKSVDAEILDEISELDKTKRMSEMLKPLKPYKGYKLFINKKRAPKGFFEKHSKVYGFIHLAKKSIRVLEQKMDDKNWQHLNRFAQTQTEKKLIPFDNGQIKTLLTPSYRLVALNLDDIRIQEGLRISLESIEEMNRQILSENIQYLVMLIPTKELVYKESFLAHAGHLPDDLAILIKNEEKVWSTTKAFLNKKNIPFVDVLPTLNNEIKNGRQVYKINWDGHPNKLGYRAIALELKHTLNYLNFDLSR